MLDEPTAQLDPMAATEFFDTLRRINRELGTTVVLSEQRLEEALPWADRVLALEGGRVLAYEEPRAVCRALAEYEAVRAKHASLLGLLEGLSDTAYAALVGPLAGDSDAETAERLSRVVRSVRDARSEAKKTLLRAGFTRESVIEAIEELRLAEKTGGRLPALR